MEKLDRNKNRVNIILKNVFRIDISEVPMEQEVQLPPQVLENLEGKSVPSKDPFGPFTVSDFHINIPTDLDCKHGSRLLFQCKYEKRSRIGNNSLGKIFQINIESDLSTFQPECCMLLR